jgi:hypothetical protein
MHCVLDRANHISLGFCVFSFIFLQTKKTVSEILTNADNENNQLKSKKKTNLTNRKKPIMKLIILVLMKTGLFNVCNWFIGHVILNLLHF